MSSKKVPTKDVKRIASLFPDYRKRNVTLRESNCVTLMNLNWDGGSRDTYTLVDLTTRTTTPLGNSMAAPWDNSDEGRKVDIPQGFAVVRTGTFCGKPATMNITFNSADASIIIG